MGEEYIAMYFCESMHDLYRDVCIFPVICTGNLVKVYSIILSVGVH